MGKVLIIFAHLELEKPRVHNRLLHHILQPDGITLNENYPHFDIDIIQEQQ